MMSIQKTTRPLLSGYHTQVQSVEADLAATQTEVSIIPLQLRGPYLQIRLAVAENSHLMKPSELLGNTWVM